LPQILEGPKNSLVKRSRRSSTWKAPTPIHPGSLYEIAALALERKTGARGLRSILERIMLDIMYELPSKEGIKELVVTEEVVRNHRNPWIVLEGGVSSKDKLEKKESA
jgi:ATP-dependent Clp protease ATP-binding subunit ClpX